MLRKSLIFIVCGVLNMAYAFDINSFFLNNNQQGMKLFNNRKYQEASQRFENKDWQAVAKYKAKDYKAALDLFSNDNSAKGLYNQGNALAHMKQYDEAIAKYDEALKINPDFEDAKYNKALLEQLKKSQEQNSKQDKQDNKQDSKQDNKQDSKQDNKQDQQEQSGDNLKSENRDNAQDKSQNNQKDNDNQIQDEKKIDGQDKNSDGRQAQQQDQTGEANKSPLAKFEDNLDAKEKEGLEAILSRIPNDPGGLLRNKFKRDYEKGR